MAMGEEGEAAAGAGAAAAWPLDRAALLQEGRESAQLPEQAAALSLAPLTGAQRATPMAHTSAGRAASPWAGLPDTTRRTVARRRCGPRPATSALGSEGT